MKSAEFTKLTFFNVGKKFQYNKRNVIYINKILICTQLSNYNLICL